MTAHEIECIQCDGNGWLAKRLPRVGGGLHEVTCTDCNGHGWRLETEDESNDRAADAFSDMCEGEPPMSQRERDEIQAKREAQWGVK